MVVNISNIKTGIHDDPSPDGNKITLKLQNIKNIAVNLHDEEKSEWEEEDDFIADLFIFKK